MSLFLASADWCTNCGPVKTLLIQSGIDFEVLDVDSEDSEAQIPEGLRGIPALIKNNKVIAVGVDNIKEWIKGNK